MTTGGFTEEFTSPIPADKLFKANVLDAHKLAPKVRSQVVSSVSFIEGDGGVGSIRQINFTDAIPFKYAKERVDILDKGKMECKLTVIDGADIGKKLETASCHIKVEPAGNGGSVYKVAYQYKTLPGIDYSDDEIQVVKEGLVGTFKAIEAYLIANPDYA